MSINIADNFQYKGSKPLDARTQYATVASMKAAAESDLSDGLRCYVKENKKNYVFDSTNTVDSTTGKWREFVSGGGGTDDYSDLDNKPQINGNELSGNKSLDDLGLDASLASAKPTFSEASSRANIASGESVATIFGKIKKYFTDLKAVAFSGSYSDLSNKPTIPTQLSQLTADSTHRVVTDTEKSTWNGKQNAITAGTNLAFNGNTLNASMPVLGIINRSDIYDTTEKVIGKWTDGRPIYQKVITLNSFTSSGSVYQSVTPHSISNIKEFVNYRILAVSSANATTISPFHASISASEYTKAINAYIDNTNVTVNSQTDRSSLTMYAILAYTKTTDSANSYNYADENDYSTSEKIIGKWIDGKTLYQKTFTGTLLKSSAVGTELATRIDTNVSIDRVIKVEGEIHSSIGNNYPLTLYATLGYGTGYIRTTVNDNSNEGSNKNKINIFNALFIDIDSATYTYYVTIQYTKTT